VTAVEIATLHSRAAAKLRQTGPDPTMISRLAVHHVRTRWQQRRLRSSYSELICSVRSPAFEPLRISLEPAGSWPSELSTALQRLAAERDAALAHTVDLLGSGPVDLGPDVDWHRDFKSGWRWPAHFYQDVTITRPDDDSDAKVPWELSRAHHLLALGRAAAIFGDERAADELEHQLTHWIDANPPGIGINWTNPMEIAIRAINWVWAIAAVEQLRPLHTATRARLALSLTAHGRHIWHNLEGSPQLRSNHYLSDTVGLLVIGAVLADDPLSERWIRYAQDALEREAREQILADGLDFEASLGYHGLVLELLLIARWFSARIGRSLSRGYDDIVRRMLGASLALRHPDGRMPQLGDWDSGRVLPAGWQRPPTHDHLLWVGAASLGTPLPADCAGGEEAALNFGLDAWRHARSRCMHSRSPARPSARSFLDAGVHVLRVPRAHLVVRCGDVGQNGNGGHSHNDLLSYEWSIDGTLVVADPGTYCYTSDPVARNELRSTAAHSTICVDDQEINPLDPARLFVLERWARVARDELTMERDELRLTCRHDGYRRLRPPVTLMRAFTLSNSGVLTVCDDLLGEGLHTVCSRLQLAVGWRAESCGEHEFALSCGGHDGLRLQIFGAAGVNIENAWVSPRFGVREHAVRLRIDASTGPRPRFGYRIGPITPRTDRR